MQNRKLYIGLAFALGFIAYSFVTAFIFNFLNGFVVFPSPLSAWAALINPPTEGTISQLWLAFGAPIVFLLFVGGAIHSWIKGKNNQLPNAVWADQREVRKAELLGNTGIILGKYKNQFLMSNTPTHAMIVAPTRSGKGVGIVTPNLLNFSGSIICLDLKHENHKNTSGFRAKHSKVYKWAPMSEDEKSHCYNPFSAISKDKHRRITDLQIFAKTLIQDPPKGDPMWTSEARALFIGLALYVFETEKEPTIGAINRLLGAEADLGDICRHIIKTHHELPASIVKPMNVFANKAAKERSGVKTSVNTALNLWDNPTIDAATSRSDFDISKIRKERSTIYVSVGTEEIETLAPLLRIFFEQVIKTLSRKEPGEDEPHQVLMILDEFHMLGRMDIMVTAFSLLAGYNVRVMAIVQSLGWLDTVYDKQTRNGILSCCAHQVFFATNDPDTEDYVSRACGETTVTMESTSQRNSLRFDPATKNVSVRSRPLIARHEVGTLDKSEQIILVEAHSPIKSKKIKYYNEKAFSERASHSMTDIPTLSIVENAIPEFNITKEPPPPKPDPNQYNMLENNDEMGAAPNLVDAIK